MARRTPKPEPEKPERSHITSGINLPLDIYQLLNRVAFQRALKRGGRPSSQRCSSTLVEQHRKELEKELEG